MSKPKPKTPYREAKRTDTCYAADCTNRSTHRVMLMPGAGINTCDRHRQQAIEQIIAWRPK